MWVRTTINSAVDDSESLRRDICTWKRWAGSLDDSFLQSWGGGDQNEGVEVIASDGINPNLNHST
jgi:hypothetical protein